MAEAQIYLLDNFTAQSWFTIFDGTLYSVQTHTEQEHKQGATLRFDLLPPSRPKQHRHMMHGQSCLEQQGKGAQEQGWSSGAQPCHGSGTAKVRACAQPHFPLGLLQPDPAALWAGAALQQRGEFQNMNFLRLNLRVTHISNACRFVI